MAEFYRMPKVGTGKSAVTITRWNVEEGQSVLPGDVLFEAEAGKMGSQRQSGSVHAGAPDPGPRG